LRDHKKDARLCYVSSLTRGLACGRNLGVQEAQADLIACTDDDCLVPQTWLKRMARALMADDRVAVVFGNVRPEMRNRPDGFIPGCLRPTPFIARKLSEQHRVDGMAGSMGLRRSVWRRLVGFDEMMGAGAAFLSAEDLDFSIRALKSGFFVHAAPSVEVIHCGFRSWAEGDRLIEGYLYGIGAMVAKHLKCRNWKVLHYVGHLAIRWICAGAVVEFGYHPPRWLRLKSFARGFAAAASKPVNGPKLLFERRHN
jgi:GT2 family glycosyltransferase